MAASEQFEQLALRFTDPLQYDYEVIRPIMLADETIAQRSRATGLDRETVGEKARRFVQLQLPLRSQSPSAAYGGGSPAV
jgi:hypothetical protein